MKGRILLALLSIGMILLMTILLPIYLVYSFLIAIVELTHTFLQGVADYFETLKDCLKGDL